MAISISGNGIISGTTTITANSISANSIVSTGAVSANTLTASNVVSANSHVISGINYSLGPQTMKNRIINGDMRIDQRFAGTANNSGTTIQYVVDRWFYNTGGFPTNRFRFQQNNTNGPNTSVTQTATGFNNYFGANVVSSNTTVNATDYSVMVQQIEGNNIADFNWGTGSASPVTLSFWVYSSIAGTYGGSIRNSNADRSYPFSYSINSANTWQYQTITVPGETTGTWYYNNTVGLTLSFSLGTGTTYSSTANGSWQAGNYFNATGSVQVVNNANGAFYLTGVQLEKGTQATSFDFRHYGTEFQLCQRYYQVYGGNGLFLIGGYGTSGVDVYNMFSFPVQMRSSPTVSSLGSWSTNNTNTPYPKVTRISSYGFCVYATLNATGSWYVDGNSSSTLITASAELGIQN